METDTTWREFGPVNEEALRMFTPEPDTMRKALFEAFLSIFLCKGAEEAGQNTNPADESGSQEVLIPSFANELTLGLSVEPDGIQELQRAKLCLPETKVSLERHILSMDLWKLDVAEGIHRSWPWTPPPDGKFSMCNVESLLHGSRLWLLSNVSRRQVEVTTKRADFGHPHTRAKQFGKGR
jgi:hypothetical protein